MVKISNVFKELILKQVVSRREKISFIH